MANAPNNPFEPKSGQGQPGYGQAPPKKSKTWLWVLLIVAALGFFSVLACCGLGYYGFNAASTMLVDGFRDHPVIVENVGNIESAGMDFQATMQYGQDNPGSNRAVFQLQGSKSDAKLAVENNPGGQPRAQLIMPDGTTFDIETGGDASIDEPLDIDVGEADQDLDDDVPSDIQSDDPAASQ